MTSKSPHARDGSASPRGMRASGANGVQYQLHNKRRIQDQNIGTKAKKGGIAKTGRGRDAKD
jgi:spore coat protein U-like protein